MEKALNRWCFENFINYRSLRHARDVHRALATGQSVQMHPSSVLFRTKPDCVIFNELVRTTQNYVKNLTRIDPLWLAELAPQYYATED
uniref:DEAD-box helicase OB fold domain-containing protein n=1 Tax=Aegilops tauschii subsp. strangulata TaxID=200361 RepID=A0A453R050_AEGTS